MMNPELNPIFARRSIRSYTRKPVSDETLHDLLEAAMAAPSACAKDPWHFITVRDRDMLNRMADGLPNGQMLREAQIGVVVCGDLDRAHEGLLSYMLQDCSAAIENLLLAASTLGLGACWLGVHPREDRVAHLSTLLTLPASVLPVSVISLGYPADPPEPRTRYRDEAVHAEVW